MTFTIRERVASTRDAFAELVERNNGITPQTFGGAGSPVAEALAVQDLLGVPLDSCPAGRGLLGI